MNTRRFGGAWLRRLRINSAHRFRRYWHGQSSCRNGARRQPIRHSLSLRQVCKTTLSDWQKTTARFGMIGTQPPQTDVHLEDIFQEVQLYFEKRLPHISRRVEIRLIPHKIPGVLANALLLHWVFENLIRNSLDAMDKAEGWIEIEATRDTRAGDIVIRYADNGSGIPRENQRKIFEPGMSTKAHGWGLGLTVVQRIIREYHHGSIRIVRTSSEGTTFEIRLPIA